MESVNTNERGKVMSSISSSSKGQRKRRTVRVLAASAFVLLAGALLPAVANADNSFNWLDGTTVRGYAGCMPVTYTGGAVTTWRFGAAQMGVNSPFGAGYNPAWVEFGVVNLDLQRVVGIDQNWRYIPQQFNGITGGYYWAGSWPYGSGRFSVSARILHNGAVTPWATIGTMLWQYGRCYN